MKSFNEHILIVDDDKAFRIATMALLKDEGYSVTLATDGQDGLRKIAETHFDLILSDLVMEGMNGIEFLKKIKLKIPDAFIIMITGFGSIKTAIEAIHVGAYDYLTKPCSNEELLIKIQRALTERRKTKDLERLRALVQTTYNFSNIISRNEKMQQLFKLVRQVAETDVSVLVLGETGTGKELVARSIHFNSLRREMPFVVVNCAAIPETLLESELFGYEKGAFTGATRQRIGKFEEANGGTIFLDEVADVTLGVQSKLLRILQEKQLERVGSNVSISTDVRVIAATNRNLDRMVHDGAYREDLYYRLNVFPINIPPLRERLDDVPLLAEYFLKKYQSLARQAIHGFSPPLIHEMMNYSWKGNVREMENLVKRAIIKCDEDVISTMEIPSSSDGNTSPEKFDSPVTTTIPYKKYLEQVVRNAEEKYLARLLKECDGNLNQVAKAMDVDRKTVYRKIEEYQIDVEKYKQK